MGHFLTGAAGVGPQDLIDALFVLGNAVRQGLGVRGRVLKRGRSARVPFEPALREMKRGGIISRPFSICPRARLWLGAINGECVVVWSANLQVSDYKVL
jgi:hypothetical protein